jgi:hypothetical protein
MGGAVRCGLVSQGKINDDKLARALDRLFAADRATLQTRIVLAVIKGFDLKMEQIHNDTTSVMVSGAYDGQNAKAVQLKRGHSKERRPDLKQLIYSLCVTSDGAVPVHFKAYDGNQTDDGIHLETWNRLRTLRLVEDLTEGLTYASEGTGLTSHSYFRSSRVAAGPVSWYSRTPPKASSLFAAPVLLRQTFHHVGAEFRILVADLPSF